MIAPATTKLTAEKKGGGERVSWGKKFSAAIVKEDIIADRKGKKSLNSSAPSPFNSIPFITNLPLGMSFSCHIIHNASLLQPHPNPNAPETTWKSFPLLSGGQRSLACSRPWGRKELDTMNNNDNILYLSLLQDSWLEKDSGSDKGCC